ncbi:unnamed protein product [Amoebophrya sp. A25]|nr:unnamed protein product [Amoebophrya sp. A25]|eukprot:GSA25T00011797001.1
MAQGEFSAFRCLRNSIEKLAMGTAYQHEQANTIRSVIREVGDVITTFQARSFIRFKSLGVSGSPIEFLTSTTASAEFWKSSSKSTTAGQVGKLSRSGDAIAMKNVPTSDNPKEIEEVFGVEKTRKLLLQIGQMRLASVAVTTQSSYESILRSAVELLGGSHAAMFPIISADQWELFVFGVFAACRSQKKHVQEGGPHDGKVKWSLINKVTSALSWYHESACTHVDYAGIARAASPMRLREALKKACVHLVEEKKNEISFGQLVLINDYLFAKIEKFFSYSEAKKDHIFIGMQRAEHLGLSTKVKSKNELSSFLCILRTMFMLRVGVLAERRKSDIIELEWDRISVGEGRSLVLHLVKTKMDRLALGCKTVVPHLDRLKISPQEIMETLTFFRSYLVEEKRWARPKVLAASDGPSPVIATDHRAVEVVKDYCVVTYDSARQRMSKMSSSNFNPYMMKCILEVPGMKDNLTEKTKKNNVRAVGLRKSGVTLYSRYNRDLALNLGGLSAKSNTMEIHYAQYTIEQWQRATTNTLLDAESTLKIDSVMALFGGNSSVSNIISTLRDKSRSVRLDILLKRIGVLHHACNPAARRMLREVKWNDVYQAAKKNKFTTTFFSDEDMKNVCTTLAELKRDKLLD